MPSFVFGGRGREVRGCGRGGHPHEEAAVGAATALELVPLIVAARTLHLCVVSNGTNMSKARLVLKYLPVVMVQA